jgi:hypothetical protein
MQWKLQYVEILAMHSRHNNTRIYLGKPKLGIQPINLSYRGIHSKLLLVHHHQYIKIPYRESPPQV